MLFNQTLISFWFLVKEDQSGDLNGARIVALSLESTIMYVRYINTNGRTDGFSRTFSFFHRIVIWTVFRVLNPHDEAGIPEDLKIPSALDELDTAL